MDRGSTVVLTSRRAFLARMSTALAGAAGAAILSACGGSAPTPTPAPPGASSTPANSQAPQASTAGNARRGGELTVAVQNDWVTMDPLFNTAEPTGFAMIYDGWIRWGKDPQSNLWGPQPWLVESWDLQQKEAKLTLRTGVKFHDGTPWNAEAAKWNLDRMIFHPASGVQASLTGVDRSAEDKAELDKLAANAAGPFTFVSKAVEIVDARTVRIKLQNPVGSLPSSLSAANAMPISPAAYNQAGKDAYARSPVGTGPMKFSQWQSGSQVVVERNPDYWQQGADGQPLPYLNKITYRLFRDDSVRLVELRSGNIQFTELIQGKDIAGIESAQNLTLVQSESSGNNYRLIFDSTNQNSPFVKHKDLRKALLYAIDREAMLQTLGFGAGSVRNYLLPKGSFAYPEGVPFYSYDQAKAAQLVKDAIAASPGLANASGKIPATLTVIQRAVDQQQAEMLKQFADTVGFDLTIEVLERAAWTAKLVRTPGQPGGEFHVATMRNPVTADDPDGQWRTFYHSKGSFNVAHLADPELDNLLDRAAASYDPEARKSTYRDLAQRAYDDPWYGFLWQQNWNWAFSTKFKNFREPVTNFWLFTDSWIE
jgi:peptide/nickel transport system substrate-binding protein